MPLVMILVGLRKSRSCVKDEIHVVRDSSVVGLDSYGTCSLVWRVPGSIDPKHSSGAEEDSAQGEHKGSSLILICPLGFWERV